jgi:hypothetical protein
MVMIAMVIINFVIIIIMILIINVKEAWVDKGKTHTSMAKSLQYLFDK